MNRQPGLAKLILVILATLLLLSSCLYSKPDNINPSDKTDDIPSSSPEPSKDVSEPSETGNNPGSRLISETGEIVGDIDDLLTSMTLEEKIGQMFFIGRRTDENGQPQLSLDSSLKTVIDKYKPGGFIFFAENLDNIDQTVSFINSLQETSRIPMFIGIDEEGGIVTRLNRAEALHSTFMPEPFVIGRTNNSEYAYRASKAIAKEVKSLGFNLNFAPVADVFSNPSNKVIGRRAYSDDANIAAEMVSEAVKGAVDAQIIPVIKHFPGHGDTLQDSHTGIAIVENNIDRLRKVEFLPFKAGINAGAGMVMTAHVLTPHITDDNLPATLSKTMLQDYLRNELGFDGVIITDGLEMSAISAYYSEEEAVVMAVEAGVDMLLLPRDFEKAFNSILEAVRANLISEERIDESVRRILTLKKESKISFEKSDLDPNEVLGSPEHRALAESIRKDSQP